MTPAYIGAWSLERTILDHNSGVAIDCHGTARLASHEREIAYDETISYTLGGKAMHATRAYRFALEGHVITATFGDGAPFFRLSLDADGIGTATHLCGTDTYTLRLRLRESSTWETTWRVSGTKQLRITTRYKRLEHDSIDADRLASTSIEPPRNRSTRFTV